MKKGASATNGKSSTYSPEEYFEIGKIANTHGLKGELRVYPYTDERESFEEFDGIYIEGEQGLFEIESIRYVKNMVLVKLKGYDDINEVLRWKDKAIYMNKDAYGELDEDTNFVVDLIGLKVVDEKRGFIGTVKDVLQNRAQDLYVVSLLDGREAFIPGVKAFIKKVDLKTGTIDVTLIDGLIEDPVVVSDDAEDRE